MVRAMRVLTGAVMLIVLCGLPVAPVWCELACPQGHDVVAAPGPSAGDSPCHETAGPTAEPSPAGLVTLAAAATAGCTHPVVVAPARTPDAGRVPVPVPTMVAEVAHLARFAPAAAGRVGHPPVRGPAPPRAPAFSPVLRI